MNLASFKKRILQISTSNPHRPLPMLLLPFTLHNCLNNRFNAFFWNIFIILIFTISLITFHYSMTYAQAKRILRIYIYFILKLISSKQTPSKLIIILIYMITNWKSRNFYRAACKQLNRKRVSLRTAQHEIYKNFLLYVLLSESGRVINFMGGGDPENVLLREFGQ